MSAYDNVPAMTSVRRWTTRGAAAGGLLMVVLALLLAPARPAQAHAELVGSTPAPNAVLANPPPQVVLTFSEAVRAVPDKIRVIGPDGSRVDRGKPSVDGAVITIAVDPGPRGTYLVSYRVISADSHPVPGGYTYSVGERSTPPQDTGAGRGTGDPVVSVAVRVARYLGYAGLVLLCGPVLVLALLWPARLSRRGPARLARSGAGLVAAATLAELWLQMPYSTGGGLFDVNGQAFADILASTYGMAHLARLGIVLCVGLLSPPVLAGLATRSERILLAVLGAAGLATWPLSGHGAASPVPAVSVVADTVHVGAMAIWLGGLLMLVAFLLRRADERELSAILPVWSRWAAAVVSALLLAGVAQALVEVRSVDQLISTTYGQLILAKVALVTLVLGTAAYARRLVRRQIAAGRPRRLRRTVGVELVVTAVILGLSATLVQTAPGGTAAGAAGTDDPGYFSTTLTSPIYSLRLEVEPATVGDNSIHLYAYNRDGKPLPVVEWKATAALPDNGVEPIDIQLLKLTDNHAIGEIVLPSAGDWRIRVTARTSDIDEATVSATVPVTGARAGP